MLTGEPISMPRTWPLVGCLAVGALALIGADAPAGTSRPVGLPIAVPTGQTILTQPLVSAGYTPAPANQSIRTAALVSSGATSTPANQSIRTAALVSSGATSTPANQSIQTGALVSSGVTR